MKSKKLGFGLLGFGLTLSLIYVYSNFHYYMQQRELLSYLDGYGGYDAVVDGLRKPNEINKNYKLELILLETNDNGYNFSIEDKTKTLRDCINKINHYQKIRYGLNNSCIFSSITGLMGLALIPTKER